MDEYQEYSHHGEDDDEEEDGVIISQNSDEKDDYDDSSRSGGSYTASTGQRTILIRNLPDRVFHQDIVDAVRGGALLHIYIRSRERTANVSFVEETAAQEFLQHTKTYGLYLAGKRVSRLVYPAYHLYINHNPHTGGGFLERTSILPSTLCQSQDQQWGFKKSSH